MLTYKIARLWGSPQGTVEKYDIDEKLVYPDDPELDFSTNFSAKLQLIRLKEEISAIISDAGVGLHFTCPLCLKKFVKNLEIPSMEGEFFYDNTTVRPHEADIFLINKKAITIDLSDLVRQEIILHFPLVPLCSRGCKGLCAHCGGNKNKTICKCKNENTQTHKPFKNLKKLLS